MGLGMTKHENEDSATGYQTPGQEIDPPINDESNMPIEINVSGQTYMTTKLTIGRDPESDLAKMADKISRGQTLFIDRDGQLFGHILNYLRDGPTWIPPENDDVRNALVREAEYFKLDGLVNVIRSAQSMKMAVSTLKMQTAAKVKILILGDSGVGKTSILEVLCDNTYHPGQASTVGVDFRTKILMVEGQLIRFHFWDTTGQERFRSVTRSYYRGAKGVIFVFDVTCRNSFTQLKNWMKDFDSNKNVDEDGHLPKMLVGNKIDLESTRVVSKEEAEEFATKNGMVYFEASAKTNVGVERIFEEITKQVLQNPDLLIDGDKKDGKRLQGGGARRMFRCC